MALPGPIVHEPSPHEGAAAPGMGLERHRLCGHPFVVSVFPLYRCGNTGAPKNQLDNKRRIWYNDK
jgi:hypothetical protein